MPHLAGFSGVRFLTRTRFTKLYQAWDGRLDRVVVIKLFSMDRAAPEEPLDWAGWRAMFLAEGRAMAALDHPNILTILASGQVNDDHPYHVFPFLPANLPGLIGLDAEGEGVARLDDRERPKSLPVPQAVGILGQVVAGLAQIHARGMVHRDIKPSNILLTSRRDLGVRICDFGMVLRQGQPGLAAGAWIGTPRYMAPEQGQDETLVSDRSDIYAAATLGARMILGRLPTPGQDLTRVMPEALGQVLMRARADDPGQRPSAVQLLGALKQLAVRA